MKNPMQSAGEAMPRKATDMEIVKAVRAMDGDLGSLKIASDVLADYFEYEFRAARVDMGKDACHFQLTYEQKIAIEYMVHHVSDLAGKAANKFEAALYGEVLS